MLELLLNMLGLKQSLIEKKDRLKERSTTEFFVGKPTNTVKKETIIPLVLPPMGEPFYCQIDNRTHSALDYAYKCALCGRYVCKDCRELSLLAGRKSCPMCEGELLPYSLKTRTL